MIRTFHNKFLNSTKYCDLGHTNLKRLDIIFQKVQKWTKCTQVSDCPSYFLGHNCSVFIWLGRMWEAEMVMKLEISTPRIHKQSNKNTVQVFWVFSFTMCTSLVCVIFVSVCKMYFPFPAHRTVTWSQFYVYRHVIPNSNFWIWDRVFN